MRQTILSSAYSLFKDRQYGKSLFAYKLFQIINPDLSSFVSVNIDMLNRRILGKNNEYCKHRCDNNIKLRLKLLNKNEVLENFFEKIILDYKGDINFSIDSKNTKEYFNVVIEFKCFQDCENQYNQYIKRFIFDKKLLDYDFFNSNYEIIVSDLFEYYKKIGFDAGFYASTWGAFKINTDLIVSLTSYGPRIKTVHSTIQSLLNQTLRGFKVILWLAEDEFKNRNNDLPKELLRLLSSRFSIKWTKDIKSYKKLIPALKEFPNSTIVTADDDILYPESWLESLYLEHLKYPQHVIAHRVHRIREKDKKILPYSDWSMRYSKHGAYYRNFFTGAGGVLYPKNSLHKDVLREDIFMKIAPTADDFWFWAMCLRNHTKIMIPKKMHKHLNYVVGTQDVSEKNIPLHKINVESGKNDQVLEELINSYPEIEKLLLSERVFEQVEVVFICDENYTDMVSVVICSLMENKFDCTTYSINILLDNVTNKDVFEDLSRLYNVSINLIDVDSKELSSLHLRKDKYCTASEAALLKFEIPNILNKKRKVLYLDIDILINKDLTELYSTDVSKVPLAAVLETGQLYSERSKKFSQRYFNSGVLLMNLDFFRKKSLSAKLISEKRKLQDYSLMDQHVFNIVFENDFLELPIIYNFLYTNLIRATGKYSMKNLNDLYSSDYEDLKSILEQSCIVHFASKDKPWKYANVPFSAKWFEFHKKSPVCNKPLARSINKDWVNVYITKDGK